MRKILLLLFCMLPVMGGCAHNYFNVPQETFADRVKVLGVVPIMVDADSDVRFPQKEELLALITTQNRIYEKDLIRSIKATNSFYTVALLDLDAKTVFSSMLFRRERRDDGGVQYNKYFWKEQQLQEIIRKNGLDAIMFVVVSGVTRQEKLYSSNLMDSLQADFNFLIMTGQIIDAQGVVLWEYPNFRRRAQSYPPFINLQYPDFDEARANMSAKVVIKYKTLEGLKRALDKRRLDLLRRETSEVEVYMDQFDEMSGMIDIDRSRKPAQPPAQPVQPAAPPTAPAPAVEQPVNPLTAPAPKPMTQPAPALNPIVKEF
jgi:hypothetical protein